MKKFNFGVFLFLTIILLVGCNEKEVQDSPVEKMDTVIINYQEKHGVNLRAGDVQYDLGSMLDRDFVIGGRAKLCDYYGYGFTQFEDKFYCVDVEQLDGKGSWYLYFDREKDREFYSDLIASKGMIVVATAFVPGSIFKHEQGRLAAAVSPVWSELIENL
ncbi:hypothetical protein NQ117_05605 [Paenibacillus sp. SC116]|uniref:hypothetical protein n=1 Tax=Paenibacillus sp. SC116 TaxID=2968986 RepID=UPI00215AB02D|nr:hypothetical protein [Paenibacillus sp. SC116]MCR8843149.1 hypothetical protein [Paenibacillus sp. SC116]